MVEVLPEIFREIQSIKSQKRKLNPNFYANYLTYNGRLPYLLKKSSKLSRNKKKAKDYPARY